MKVFITLCLVLFFLGSNSSALGYEDKPFEFHVVVPDSVLLFIRGVVYSDFDLTYTPGDLEIFINGAPIFSSVELETEIDCVRHFVGVESAQARIRQGIPCDKIKRWYENEKNVLVWRASDKIQSGKKRNIQTSDYLLRCSRFVWIPQSPLILLEHGF